MADVGRTNDQLSVGSTQGDGSHAGDAQSSHSVDLVQIHENGSHGNENEMGNVLAVTGGLLTVSACGRTCNVNMGAACSINEVQVALQHHLQMEGQMFHLFDCNGQTLNSNAQLQEAVVSGLTPLCATLTDASIHYIENRREELAQMQWKLVRDQMTATTGHCLNLQASR